MPCNNLLQLSITEVSFALAPDRVIGLWERLENGLIKGEESS